MELGALGRYFDEVSRSSFYQFPIIGLRAVQKQYIEI